ncbi:MAG: M56 family metallopeptidase [Muribaculaceae bacterium]
MGELLAYSIISGLAMLALYLAFRVFLSRHNQHSFNRGVLLCIYLVAFATPHIFPAFDNVLGQSSPEAVSLEAMPEAETIASPLQTPIWGTILIWIFVAGMIVVAAKTIITWLQLTRMIGSGKKIKREGYTLVVTDNEKFAPFSWMHYIVISQHDYEHSCSAITTHELKHIEARHWIDLLIAQAVCIINWFNPAAWLMRDELMLIHEYQADMAVIDCGHNAQEYQLLLIKKAVGNRFPSLANSLNHSKIKKRITMMYKERSGAGHKLKALALVPMLALALEVAGIPAVRAAVSTISSSEVSVNKGRENLPESKILIQRFKVISIYSDETSTTAVIKGEQFRHKFLFSQATFTNNGKTYQSTSQKFELNDGTAEITVSFPFTGELINPKMAIVVNGKETLFDLDEYNNEARSSNTADMEIYLDGEKISEAELEALSPDKIASITVDKNRNMIIVTTKK